MFTRIREGYGGVENQKAMSLGQLGLDWNKYSGSFEDTLRFIQDVKNALKASGMSENEKVMHLQNLGLSNWKYLFEKEDFDIGQTLNISDEQIRNLQEASEKTNEIKNNIDQIKKNVTARVYDKIGKTVLERTAIITGTDEEAKRQFVGFKTVGEAKEQLKEEIKELWHKIKPLEVINDASLNSGAVEAAALPSLPNIDNKTTINLTNNISGSNVQFEELTAEETNSLTGGRDVEINAYTTHNNTGL
jgi:hypothetical protein